jgi:tetratricopeptide (TPR) repeat protein
MYHKISYHGKGKLFFLFLLLLVSGKVAAQPGGGGGLVIGSLFSNKLDSINLLTDTALSIRTFILAEGKVYQETFLYQIFLKEKGNLRISRHHHGFGLPPANDINEDRYADRESNQRMYLVYKQDTMIIDFMGIIGENGMGNSDTMDSLVIQKGYFKYNRSKHNNRSYKPEEDDSIKKWIAHGLTRHTRYILSQKGYITSTSRIDLSFLREDKLPSSYFLKRAAYYLQNEEPSLALADINKGIEKNKGATTCEALYLFCDAYTKTGDYDKAIENITLAIDCTRDRTYEDWEGKVENYRTRIELFITQKKYHLALRDYNTIVRISQDTIGATIERAGFKMKYLKAYQSAISDLKLIIDSIPDNHLRDRPQGWSEYCTTYFTLATAEYLNGNTAAAFRYWLKAEEFGYGQSSSLTVVDHFDSIITQHPKAPLLYLSRALAHAKRAPYLGWGEQTTTCFNNALSDISTAEALGLNDHRINMYRSWVLNQLKRHEEALKAIDKAIAKNSTDPRCFSIRYDIRNRLGQTKWGDKNDTDLTRFNKLLQDWKWVKY